MQKTGPKLSTASVCPKFLANLIPMITIPAKANSPPANSSPCNLMYLPGEIIDFILRKLEPRDLLHLTQVNQTLRYISLLRLEAWFDMRLPARERLLKSHTPELSPMECTPPIGPANDRGEGQAQVEFDLYVKLSLREFNQFQSGRNAAVSADCMVASAMVTAGNLLARLWRPDYSTLKQSTRFGKARRNALNLKNSGMNAANAINSITGSNSNSNSNSSTLSANDEIMRRAEFIVYWIAREVFVTGEMSPETAILVLEFLDEQYPIWGAIHTSHFSKLAESEIDSRIQPDLLLSDSFLFSNFFFRISQQVTEALLNKPCKTDISTTITVTATTITGTSLFKALQVPLPVPKEFKSMTHQVQCMMVWPLRSCQIDQFHCSQIKLFLPNDYCKYSNRHPAGFNSVLFDILQGGFLKASLTNFFFTRYDRTSPKTTKCSEPTTGEHAPMLCTESATSIKDLFEIPESKDISACLGRYWDLRQESDRILDAIIKGPEVNNAQMLSAMQTFTGVLSFTGKSSRITRPRKRVRRV
ncbi:hypothetical protein BGZ80_001881 [Entomortierella chlamydospora]|uniref:F-box domain-containing protein n=1 Tax=Entomortierella chlamydospora TaxID=101097 RepID=A0A9P6MRG5_9FUNG|nr:hypothetical protein BGZ80_001881 [Entomortierella chlamydospora]